jgi:hypothetical protein
MPLRDVVSDGDRLESLRALRDRIAATIDATDSARDVAALSRQLTDVLQQIEAIEKATPGRKGTPLDELAKRRAGRGAGAKGGVGSAGGAVRG